MNCPFCHRIETGDVTYENDLSAGFPDINPLGEGHTLVVARAHEPDWFALDQATQWAMMDLLGEVRRDLGASLSPAGYNVGLNVGAVAGQSVPHAHVHIIPRFDADGLRLLDDAGRA